MSLRRGSGSDISSPNHQTWTTERTVTSRTSTGGGGKGYLSAISVGLASRRLSFSQCDLTCDFHNTDQVSNPTSSDTSSDDDNSELEDLKQKHEELTQRFQRQVVELREKVSQLDFIEDRNQKLEIYIQSMRKENRQTTERLETTIAQAKVDLEQQNEALDETKEELRDKTSRLTRLAKEIHDLKKDLEGCQAELDKAVAEVRWYQSQHATLKDQLRSTQEAFQVHAHEESLKSLELIEENHRISAEFEDLLNSNKKLELAKCELEESLAENRSQQEPGGMGFKRSQSVYEDAGDLQVMDTETLLNTAFPPTNEVSIFSEMQSTLLSLPRSFIEASSQTEDQPQIVTDPSLEANHPNPANLQSPDTLLVSSEGTPNSIGQAGDLQTVLEEESAWTMIQPIDNRRGTVSMGVVPEEHREHMIQYAYDVPLRSCNQEAAILSRQEWRTLHSDLDQVDLERFKKSYGQEEETDDISLFRASRKTDDLDEFAETYAEQFPFLAESIFEHLQSINPTTATLSDLPLLKARFEELATTFRSDHDQLDRRGQIAMTVHTNATGRLSDLSLNLQRSLQAIRSQKLPGEVRELCNSVSDSVATLDTLTKSLDGSAKVMGRFDALKRVLKMIEVMVLYVRLLKTICANMDEERNLTKKLLLESGVQSPESAIAYKALITRVNNNDEVVDESRKRVQKLVGTRMALQAPVDTSCLDILSTGQKSRLHTALSRFSQRAFAIHDWISREFTWPWDGKTTWTGIRKIFAIILMVFGLLLITQLTSIPACSTSLNVESLMEIAGTYPIRL